MAAMKYLMAANEVNQLLSASYESKLESNMGSQKHKNNGSNNGNTDLIRALYTSERIRKSSEIAKMDNGISARRRNGNKAKKEKASQAGHTVWA
jgi:hypothetical protein